MPRELQVLEADLQALRKRPELRKLVDRTGQIDFGRLDLADLATLLADPTAYLLLMAAADLNRTALRSEIAQSHAQLVAPVLRRAFVVQSKLPPTADFDALVGLALQRRAGTLGRNSSATTETLFRDRLTYEIAEVSLELKFLYGDLHIRGLNLAELLPESGRSAAQEQLRRQITAASPVVVALLLSELEHVEYLRRYRAGIEAFIDRVFFADEIDECLSFLTEIAPPGEAGGD